MDISAISNKYLNNAIQSSSIKSSDDDFEKKLQNALENKDEKELKKVCKEFEGILLEIMYKQMRATVPNLTLYLLILEGIFLKICWTRNL